MAVTTAKPVVLQPDTQKRHRRASFGKCFGGGSGVNADTCRAKSDPAVCRDLFHKLASTSDPHLRHSLLPRFNDPDYLGGKHFQIVRQLGSGRSGALVFLVKRAGEMDEKDPV